MDRWAFSGQQLAWLEDKGVVLSGGFLINLRGRWRAQREEKSLIAVQRRPWIPLMECARARRITRQLSTSFMSGFGDMSRDRWCSPPNLSPLFCLAGQSFTGHWWARYAALHTGKLSVLFFTFSFLVLFFCVFLSEDNTSSSAFQVKLNMYQQMRINIIWWKAALLF